MRRRKTLFSFGEGKKGKVKKKAASYLRKEEIDYSLQWGEEKERYKRGRLGCGPRKSRKEKKRVS